MKIGFLITYFYPVTGGAENNCYYLARELAKKHEVHVFCSGNEDSDEKIDGINVHRSKEIFRAKYYLGFYPSIVRKMQEYPLDVLHVHGFGFIQHDIAIARLKKANPSLKIVCTPHGPFMALKKYNLLGNIYKAAYMPFLKRSLKKCNVVIRVNPYQSKWMKRDYGIPAHKIKYLPNGISKSSFKKLPGAYKNKVYKKYHLQGKFILAYVGRIQRYKGLDQVISVLPELKKMMPDILFLAIGKDVGDQKRLEQLAEKSRVRENVLFAGPVSEDEKLALLDLSKIFVFPSEWEAFGIVVLEAMARGKAIVSSRTEGGRYLIKEGHNGFLFDYQNKKELLHKLMLLLQKDRLLRAIKTNNIRKSKQFLWENISKDLEKIYRDVNTNKF